MRILIVGASSYIARQFTAFCSEHRPSWQVDALSVRDDGWKTFDFSVYDSILYCAAIVHQKERMELTSDYQRVNCQVPVQMAELFIQQKTQCGKRNFQFIYLSTMAVFGLDGRIGKPLVIDSSTPLHPKTLYGKSKLDAERGLQALAAQTPEGLFSLAIFRPPMVYGPQCPGNYQKLKRVILRFHLFPSLRNQRSMIHIDTLCQKLLACVEEQWAGTFHPQEDSYICTADMARSIADEAHSRVFLCPLLNPLVYLGDLVHPAFRKIWGGLVYDFRLK